MAQLLVLVPAPALLLLLAVLSAATTSATAGGKPLVTAITRDAATKLYTAPLKDSLPLVLDLAGPLIWSTCAPAHTSYECHHAACAHAHAHHPPGCPRTGHGVADESDPFRCKCRAHPYNPVARRAGSGDLTRARVTANATDGANPVAPVSFTAVAACAPPTLLAGLPAGAVGVAGLARSKLSLPAQVASKEKVPRKFALCLPGAGGSPGVAIFGGGPLFLTFPSYRPDFTAALAGTTPLLRGDHSVGSGYFVSANGIAVNQAKVEVAAQMGPLAVALSSRVPYTELRHDVYGPLVRAFDAATAGMKRVAPPPPPFELCYDSTALSSTRVGYGVPQVDLMLESGANWTVFGANSLVQVDDHTACFAFVEMKEEKMQGGHGGYGGAAAPAVVIGGYQMENNLLVFDEEKEQLGFSGLLFGRQTTCSNFNFTLAG